MVDRSSTSSFITSPLTSAHRAGQPPTNWTAASAGSDVIPSPPHGRYYGYIPDLLHALSVLMEVRCELYAVPDGSYGSRKSANEWSGLIGEVVSGVSVAQWRS